MATQGDFDTTTVVAGADLSTRQYRIIHANGNLATGVNDAAGVLQNKPQSGEHATIGYSGQMKVYAGAAISSLSTRLKVTSGGFVAPVASGDISCGFNLDTAASGDLIEGIFDFAGGRG